MVAETYQNISTKPEQDIETYTKEKVLKSVGELGFKKTVEIALQPAVKVEEVSSSESEEVDTRANFMKMMQDKQKKEEEIKRKAE